MSAATVAARLTADAGTRAKIESLLNSNGFTNFECDRALRVVDFYLNVCGREGIVVDEAMILRAGAFAVDHVWSARTGVGR